MRARNRTILTPTRSAMWDVSRCARSLSSSGTAADVHHALRTPHQRLLSCQDGLADVCGRASTALRPIRPSLSQFILDVLPQAEAYAPRSHNEMGRWGSTQGVTISRMRRRCKHATKDGRKAIAYRPSSFVPDRLKERPRGAFAGIPCCCGYGPDAPEWAGWPQRPHPSHR